MLTLDALLAGLPDQFDRTVRGRTLILDADGPAYQAASTAKTLPTALRRFQTLVETERFVTGADEVQVHLTPRGCLKCRRGDYPSALEYQANRSTKVRPKPPLLHPLRDAIAAAEWPENWSVYSWMDREADDGMIMQAHLLGERGVVLSADKDLRLTPGPYWEVQEGRLDVLGDRFGWIKAKHTASSAKVVGHGTKFFWAQMLMGDTADNVKGIKALQGKLCGPAAAYNFLHSMEDESQAAQAVLDAYAAIKQDPLAEAQCLWLRRSNEDCAFRYLMELDLTAQMRAWLTALHSYHQEVLSIRAAARDEEKYSGEDQSSSSAGSEAQRDPSPGGIDLPWD